MVLRAVVVGEQQQPERDLADDQRLREREQLRHRVPGAAATVRDERGARREGADRDDEERVDVVHR